MKGWLIVNRFLYTDKFSELYDWLIRAAAKAGSELTLLTNDRFLVNTDSGEVIYPEPGAKAPDYVIFWDKDIRLAGALEAQGLRLYNRADAIEACDDKSLTLSRLAGKVRMPKTFTFPFTYEHLGFNNLEFLDRIEAKLSYPFIIKECFGSFGAQVYLARSHDEAVSIIQNAGGRPCIAQEYIGSGRGRDIRINVVGDECVAAMLRYNDEDFRANITAGGHMKQYAPTDAQQEMALKVCRELKLDYAGVDILFGPDDEPVLCEVNSNAHFKSIYDCTGINVADALISHILGEKT
ncbi:MAG TPA: RimK family alpha-L-glutamate ligase [Lachnospiraceae bacterium]|nr:RimK family alpha-L-glutamate ligase [Lachnospiraceae bacterium]